MKTTQVSYHCPDCDSEIDIPDDCLTTLNNTCRCKECGSEFVIDWDADFENGMWHDKTKLYPITIL